MTYRPDTTNAPEIAATTQSLGSRLVRNPIRPVHSTLFTGWGPRLRP